MTIIGTKWVFRNKLDENVARLKSIRILLDYACALDFKLLQMDVKSAFLNDFINEEVYVAQPPGFTDFEKPNHVYKLKKALYGLKQAPKAWPDIMFSVCLCARFQEAPKTSHLEAVKRIFRYIKGTTHLGLWYPKGTDIETVVYADSDHAGDYVAKRALAKYNLAYFIAKQMEFVTKQARLNLPYGMLLTRLFEHVVFENPELLNHRYVLYDRVMYPFTAQQERKTQKDYGMKRGCHSTSSSSSFGQSSSYYLNDDDDNDRNDEAENQHDQPENSNELFQKLLEDLKNLAEYKESLKNSSKEIAILNSNEEKEIPPQDSDIHQLIEECSTKVCEEQKQSIDTSQISLIHAIAPILSNKEPEHSLSMGYEHLSITPETESDEVTESNAENPLPIPSECEVTLKDKKECDVPICDNHSDTFSDSKIDDDISVYDDDFEDIEYVEASLSNPDIVSVEEENVVHQAENDVYQEEKIDLEDISQIQDVVLREKQLSITHNFSPKFETFCDHSKETRSGNTTHADNSLPEYDSFCFEIEPDQEMLINLVKNDISNVADDSIPSGIENVADDSEGEIRFLEELLIDESILSHKSSDSSFEDNPLIPRPPPEPPDAEIDAGEEILVVMNDKDEDVDYSSFIFVIFAKVFSFLSAESEDNIFDPGVSD
nr:retrovirus-related Pol polyprotein from transposon TNT 1-94 [Tanacetum cinerariifolium]